MSNIVFTDVRMISANPADPESIVLGETCAVFDLVQAVSGQYVKSVATDAALGRPSHILIQAGVLDDNVAAFPLVEGASLRLIGATPAIVVGDQYVLSATAGRIAERADLLATQILTDIAKGEAAAEDIVLGVDATGLVI